MMRLNHDLVRDILIEIGSHPSNADPAPVHLDGYSRDDIEEHIYLLINAGYLEACSFSDCAYYVSRITWEGHKFVDNIEDYNVWEETKKSVKSRVINASIDIIAKVATNIIYTKMGIS